MCLTVAMVTQLLKEALVFQLLSSSHCYYVLNLGIMFWILALQVFFVQLDKTFYSETPFVRLCVVPSVLEGQQPPQKMMPKKKKPTSPHHFWRSDLTLNIVLFFFLPYLSFVHHPELSRSQWGPQGPAPVPISTRPSPSSHRYPCLLD